MSDNSFVRLMNAGIGEKNGVVVMTARIENQCLQFLKYGSYQREEQSSAKIEKLARAWAESSNIPAVSLMILGDEYTTDRSGNPIIPEGSG